MATVFIPPQMRDLTGGQSQVEVAGATLRQVLRALDEGYPGLGARLCQDDRITSGLAISIDGTVTSRGLLAQVGPQSQIHIVPAIGGG